MPHSFGRCPHCSGWAQHPGSGESGRLRCPHCRTLFEFAAWRAEQPPLLEIVLASDSDEPEPGSIPWEEFPDWQQTADPTFAAQDSAEELLAPLREPSGDLARPTVTAEDSAWRVPTAVASPSEAACSTEVWPAVREPDPANAERLQPASLPQAEKVDTLDVFATLPGGLGGDGDGEPIRVHVDSPFIQPAAGRPRRGNKGALREVVKIAAGGAAGLAIAQLLLWWAPTPYRRDPFGIAPQLPAKLSFLLPAALRASDLPTVTGGSHQAGRLPIPATQVVERDLPDADAPPAADEAHLAPSASLGELGPEINPFSDELSFEEADRLAAATDLPLAPPAREDSAEDDRQHLMHDPPETIATDLTRRSEPASPETPPRPAYRLEYSSESLQESLGRAAHAWEQIQTAAGAPKEVRQTLAKTFYERLCDVAQIVAFVNSDDPAFGQRMNATEALLARLAHDPGLATLLGRTSASWIQLPSRTCDGIVLAGEVTRIEACGSYYVSFVQPLGRTDAAELRVIATQMPPLDPRSPYDVGARILVMGSIIARPADELPELPLDGPVIWAGLQFVVGDGGENR